MKYIGYALLSLGAIALIVMFWAEGHRFPLLGTSLVLMLAGIFISGNAAAQAEKEGKK